MRQAQVLLSVVSVLMAILGNELPGQGRTHAYSYLGRSIGLSMDVSRIAVRCPGGAASLEVLLGGIGIPPSHPTAWPIAPWYLVETPPGLRTEEGVEQLVSWIARAQDDAAASPVFFGSDGGPLFIAPEILVAFRKDRPAGADELVIGATAAADIIDREWGGMERTWRLRTRSRDGGEVLDLAGALANHPDVAWAEPVVIFTGRAGYIPDDPLFAQLWGLHNTGQSGGTPDIDIDAPEAWDLGLGSPSVLVVVIDVGVQQDHPDINQAPGRDLTDDGPAGGGGPVNGCDNHGTVVAGCVSAIIDNDLGVVGAAPGCRVASARTFKSIPACNGAWTSMSIWTVDALDWAQQIGARVTNNSNGYGFASNAIAQKYSDTRNAGLVHFAAAGNFSSTTLAYPASLPAVNAVAAIDRYGFLAWFSNSGVGLDLAAPGMEIWTTDRTGVAGYGPSDDFVVDGTSFASPYAAGVAALVVSRNPGLSAGQVEQILQTTCMDLGSAGYDPTFGWGLVNAHQAAAAAGPCTPTITAQPSSLSACAGATAGFGVSAGGSGPFTWQWRKDGVPIPGATGSAYSLSSVSASDAGAYTVVVSNSCGSTTSSAAILTVNEAPAVSAHPASLTVQTGQSVTLSASAAGTPPLTWQWRKNGVPLGAATAATYTINAASISDAGGYDVMVSNGCGATTSTTAVLTVANPLPLLNVVIPPSAIAGSGPLTVMLLGSGFTSQSQVRWNGSTTGVTSVLVTSTFMEATLGASLLAGAGAAGVTVVNPAPGGGQSQPHAFTVNNPVPTLSSMQPDHVTAGSGAVTVTLAGSWFLPQSQVQWNGSAAGVTSIAGTSTQMQATFAAGLLSSAGVGGITVFNPAPGGGASNGSSFLVNNPLPVLTGISPATVAAGSPPFTLAANGSQFVSGARIVVGGTPLATTLVDATQLVAPVPASLIAAAVTYSVMVENPWPVEGPSNTLPLVIASLPSVLVVDSAGGAPFADIQPAVDAAAEGSIVLVRGGSYGGFSIDGKALTVTGDTGAVVQLTGSNLSSAHVGIRNLQPGQTVVLRSLEVVPAATGNGSQHGLAVENNQGAVIVEHCTLAGDAAAVPGGASGWGVAATSSASVTLRACSIVGGAGQLGGEPGGGLRSTGSTIAVSWGTLTGAAAIGSLLLGPIHDGAPGARIESSFLFASRVNLQGGDGGPAPLPLPIPCAGGDGGPGLLVIDGGSQAKLIECTTAGGQGGPSGIGCPPGNPGPAVQAPPGTFDLMAGVSARELSAEAPLREGEPLVLTFTGEPGEIIYLGYSLMAEGVYLPAASGFVVPALASLQILPVPFLVPPAGVLSAVLTPSLPDLGPGINGLVIHGQAAFFDSAGSATLSSPEILILLDQWY